MYVYAVCRESFRYIVRALYTQCLSAGGDVSVLESIIAHDYKTSGLKGDTRVALMEQIAAWRRAVPDMHWKIEEMLVDGSRVVVRCEVSGSPVGDFLGLTGLDGTKRFSINAIDINMVEDGVIKGRHSVQDWQTAIIQLK